MTSTAKTLRLRTWTALAVIFGLSVLLVACGRSPNPITLSGETMGTYWTVRLAELPPSQSIAGLRGQINRLLDRINDEMSTYREDSVISRFNGSDRGDVVELPEGFSQVLAEALYWAEASDGAFDPTAGSLVNLWGFGPVGAIEEAPSQADIDRVKEHIGWQRLEFDPASRTLYQSGQIYLDLSAIAKGWGVDEVTAHLTRAGVGGFLVDIGGELHATGTKADGTAWRVGIERPALGRREAVTIIEIKDMAIATSGNYRNFFEADGRQYSHLIDPRTGWPITHNTVSVTVLSETAIAADALATVLSVMNVDDAYAFARDRNLAVFWLLADNEAFSERMTPEFQRLLGDFSG